MMFFLVDLSPHFPNDVCGLIEVRHVLPLESCQMRYFSLKCSPSLDVHCLRMRANQGRGNVPCRRMLLFFDSFTSIGVLFAIFIESTKFTSTFINIKSDVTICNFLSKIRQNQIFGKVEFHMKKEKGKPERTLENHGLTIQTEVQQATNYTTD